MNELIKAIASKAGMEDYPTRGVNSLHGEEAINKFAELLIEKCARIAYWSTDEGPEASKAIRDMFFS